MRYLAEAVDPEAAAESKPEDPVLAAFTGGINNLDQLAERSGLDGAELGRRLTELELQGRVERAPGGYQLLAGGS
jgi:DNA processing protein